MIYAMISNIDICRDGGTIGIFGVVRTDEMHITMSVHQPAITIDYSIGTDTPGKWYFGWKRDGKPVEDEELIQMVKIRLQEWIHYKQAYIDKII